MWADCPDWIQAIILDNIRGTIRAKMEKEHSVRQDHCEGYTDHWAAVAAKLQSPTSSQAMQQPAHRIQTPSSRRIGTPPGQQHSQNDLQNTDLSFDFCQTPSAAHVIRLFGSDTPSGDDSREVTRGLSLNKTMSASLSRRLSLNLDGIEPAKEGKSDREQGDVEQERNESLSEGI